MQTTEIHSYLTTASRLIDKLDLTQIGMVAESLRRLRQRDGQLHIASHSPNLHIVQMFLRTGIRTKCYTTERPTRDDGLLILAEHTDPPYQHPENGPTTYAIVSASGGDVARNVNYCVVIPSFLTPHVEGAQLIVLHCLAEALR